MILTKIYDALAQSKNKCTITVGCLFKKMHKIQKSLYKIRESEFVNKLWCPLNGN